MNKVQKASSTGLEQKVLPDEGTCLPEPLRVTAQEHHHAPLRRLLRLLARPNKFQLILLQFNSPEYRDKLAQSLLSSMSAGSIWKLDREILGCFAGFEAILAHKAAQSNPLQIVGLEAWPFGDGTDDLFKGFNYHREAIADLGCTLLLWLTEPDIKQFALEAPDMWAWRAIVLDLSTQLPKALMQESGESGLSLAKARIPEVANYLAGASEPTPSLVLDQVGNLIKTGELFDARELMEKWHNLLHRKEQPTHVKLAVMAAQADLAQAEGRVEHAMTTLKEMEAFCKKLGDDAALARCYGKQALFLQSWGELSKALALFQKQQGFWEALGDRVELSRCYSHQATILRNFGRLEDALVLLRQQEALCEVLRDRAGLSLNYNHQASIFWAWGKVYEAMALLQKQQDLSETLGDRSGLAISYGNQAMIFTAWGKLDEAMALLQKQQAVCEALGDLAGLSVCYGNQATILKTWGRLLEAIALLEKQQALCGALGDRAGLANCLWNMGALFKDMGQPQECLRLWRHAVGLRVSLGLPLKDDQTDREEMLAVLERELQA